MVAMLSARSVDAKRNVRACAFVDEFENRVADANFVELFEHVDQLEDLARLILVQVDLDAGQERQVGRLVVDAGLLQGGADRDHVGRLGDDLEGVAEVVDLLGAGVEDRHQHVVLA